MLDEKLHKDKSQLKYENLIYYRICESMYIQMKLKTKYNTFSNMCSNISDSMLNGMPVYGKPARVVSTTISHLIEMYGLTYTEAVEYILDFLRDKKWNTYQEIVTTFYNTTKKSFQ